MSKSYIRDKNKFYDDEIEASAKKPKKKFGKDGRSSARREKMSSKQIMKAFETGRLISED